MNSLIKIPQSIALTITPRRHHEYHQIIQIVLIDCNTMLTHLSLFYAKMLRNRVLVRSYLYFFVIDSSEFSFFSFFFFLAHGPIEYVWFFNISTWNIFGIQTGTNTLIKGAPESNGNEVLLLKSPKLEPEGYHEE